MLIEDLHGQRFISQRKWKNWRELHKTLIDRGFTELGRGAYAIVLAGPEGSMVVKIIDREDECWEQFMHFIISEGAGNEHFPIVYDYREVKDSWDRFSFAYGFIERLKPVDWKADIDFAVGFYSYINFVYNDAGPFSKVMNAINGFLHKSFVHPQIGKASAAKFMEREPSFCSALQLAKARLFSTRCRGDMHTGNIMMRGSTPVIIDPVAYSFYGEIVPKPVKLGSLGGDP